MGTQTRAVVAIGSIGVIFVTLLALFGSTVGIDFDGTLYMGLVGAFAAVGVGVSASLASLVVVSVVGVVTFWVMEGGN